MTLFKLDSPHQAAAGDSIDISLVGSDTSSATGQFLVQRGGSFYLSQTTFGSDAPIDPFAESWALYGIAEGDKDLIPGSLTFDVPGASLTQIKAVGYLYRSNGGSGNKMGVDGLTADLTVPEPATLALVLLGGAGLAMRRRGTRSA